MIPKSYFLFALAILAVFPTVVQAEQEAVFINEAVLDSLGPLPVAEGWRPGDPGEPVFPAYIGGGGKPNAVTVGSGSPSAANSDNQSRQSGDLDRRLAENEQSSSSQGSQDGALGLSVALYAGQLTEGNFSALLYKPWDTRFKDTNFLALSAAYQIYRFPFGLSFEVEAGVGKRFSGEDMWEFWTAAAVRWDNFPWNDFVKTTVGVAFFGPNYTTRVSEHEAERNGGEETQWMNLFAPEITLAHPDLPQAALLIRLHHRSGLGGLYNGTTSGSTFLSVGTRVFF